MGGRAEWAALWDVEDGKLEGLCLQILCLVRVKSKSEVDHLISKDRLSFI